MTSPKMDRLYAAEIAAVNTAADLLDTASGRNAALAQPFRAILNRATPHVKPRDSFTMPAVIPVYFTPTGCMETERADMEVEITFTVKPGRPAQGPTYACGGTPAEPAEVEFLSATLTDGDGISPDASQLADYAETWLMDYGYDSALEWADEHAHDPCDDIRDRLIDDRLAGGDL